MKIISILVCLILFVSCAHKIKYKAEAIKKQSLIYQNDQEIIISEKSQSTVKISCTPAKLKVIKRLKCFISVLNKSNSSQVFGINKIKVKVAKESLKIMSYGDLRDEIESKRKAQRIASAFGRGMQQAGAQMQASSGYNANTANQYSNNNYQNNNSAEVAKLRIDNEYYRREEVIQISANNKIAELSDYIRKTTIPPGRELVGSFEIDKIKKISKSLRLDRTPLRIFIKAGKDQHQFKINKQRVK